MKLAVLLRLDNKKLYVNSSYLSYFRSLGYEVSVIDLSSSFKAYDIFILPGGYDINPIFYNEENTYSNGISKYNDDFDFKVIAYAMMTNKKVLGICRGIQSINVFFNGTLYQDILHHQMDHHFIQIKNKYILVNSRHHQSIKQIGNYCNQIGISLDKQIEILQHKNKKIIGVQFHPEIMNSPIISSLIVSFLNEV